MLAAGALLGPYRILAPLGAGGMGEVYRAHDSRLGRDVAIKVLPARSLLSVDARARFEREARTISQLSHPHICTLHDVGREGETEFLVMELLEGETLAHRIARGALPVADVLKLGAEIASALDRAHAAGVVHRDLKPGNVMLTKSGAKLMDFGLARVGATPASSSGAALSVSPTQTLTSEGAIVGTFQYMAPEQLEGREADARADIWALGCVLYEMATGKRAFAGESQASLIAAIMTGEPRAMSELAPLSPPALQHVVARCLAKDPADRWQSARDLMHALELTRTSSGTTAPPAALARASHRGGAWLPLVVAPLLGLAFLGIAARMVATHGAHTQPAFSLEIALPEGLRLCEGPAISPDGRWLVFAAVDSTGTTRLWLRGTITTELHALPGTESDLLVLMPFWSPDSRQIGFFAHGKLMRVARDGGEPVAICDVDEGRGGSWSRDGVILFGSAGRAPLMRVSASSGTPVALSVIPIGRNGGPRYPSFLPDGRHFVCSEISPACKNGVPAVLGTWWASLDGGPARHVLDSESAAQFVAPDVLLFRRDGSLWMQHIDCDSGALRGSQRPLAASAVIDPLHLVGAPLYAANPDLLVIETGRIARDRLYWFDRSGRLLAPASDPLPRVIGVVVSPMGDHALAFADGQPIGTDLSQVDLSSGVATLLGYQHYPGNGAGWLKDGRRAFYQLAAEDRTVLRTTSPGADPANTGSAIEFAPADSALFVDDCTPDGSILLGYVIGASGRKELRIRPVGSPLPSKPYLSGPFDATGAVMSPDGSRVVFTTNETGSNELYLSSFKSPGTRTRVSSEGLAVGDMKMNAWNWSHDGNEIIYLSVDGRVMAADVGAGPGLEVGTPHELFRVPANTHALSWTRDGNRFLLALPGEPPPPQHFTVLVNWQNAEAK